MVTELAEWLREHGAEIAFLIPVMTLSGSALAFVIKMFIDLADRRRKHFLELLVLIDQGDALAGKLAAVYQLSGYRRHRDFLIMFFDSRDRFIDGKAGAVLKEEMRLAAERLRARF